MKKHLFPCGFSRAGTVNMRSAHKTKRIRLLNTYLESYLREGVDCHRKQIYEGTQSTWRLTLLNSLTFAFAEVTGRSYGGGVLTFEPSEAERLPLPLINAEQLDLAQCDQWLRANRIEDVLDVTDKVLRQEGLGLSAEQARMLRGIWVKLRDRRINRK